MGAWSRRDPSFGQVFHEGAPNSAYLIRFHVFKAKRADVGLIGMETTFRGNRFVEPKDSVEQTVVAACQGSSGFDDPLKFFHLGYAQGSLDIGHPVVVPEVIE